MEAFGSGANVRVFRQPIRFLSQIIPSMTHITVFPEILEPVPRGITKFAIRDAARTMAALRKSEVKVGKDERSE